MRKQIKDIAVIGHACRFPGGANTPDAFWQLLLSGTDAVTQVPPERFDQRLFFHPDPAAPGKAYTFAAGTLGDVSGFDADFFGISPREASQIDPQQRLLLEMTWEALERAGQIPEKLAGTDCAVYIGMSSTDYSDRRMGDLEASDAYFMLGAVLSIGANRISYVYDFHGPSLVIDTACSSSLVAMHEAVHALRGGRAPMAIVGGINLLLSPYAFVGFSKAGMLAPYGRSRAFDKIAQGYVRAEGGGVLVLKPLVDAEQDGDPILAVIKGVGTNTDGRTHGIALPSSAMQEALLTRVYRDAHIQPRNVSYVEAHGTGTAVGDPAEAGALGRAIGKRRPKAEPLLIGSVKTNIGHLEPAAGMAGVIKAIEILHHRIVPPTLHQEEPNPDIPFKELGLKVVREPTPLPRVEGRSIVGVNSFGFGGANAHVVLESYAPPPNIEVDESRDASSLPFPLSARTDKALAEVVRQIDLSLEHNKAEWSDIAYTAACRRSHHEHRIVLRANDTKSARTALASYAAGDTSAPQSGAMLERGAKVALVFTGNGSQHKGMGQRLYAEDETFRAAIERVETVARWRLGWSVAQIFRGEADPDLDDTRIAQPLLLALQIGLLESLRARGLKFDAVLGHSVGEVAAAYASGALTIEQAFHVIRERSNAQAQTRGLGRMMAMSMSAEQAAEEVEPYEGNIEIAAINSPRAVTLCGDVELLRDLSESLKEREINHQLLDLDYAFHGRTQDRTRELVLRGLSDLRPVKSPTLFYSAVTGGQVSGTELDAGYWWRNIRQPVQFGKAVDALARDGFRIFLEMGPHPLLQGYIHQQLKAAKIDGQPIPSLNKSEEGPAALDRGIDRAFVLGADIDFGKLFPAGGKVVPLPTYPWQRERHWHSPTAEAHGELVKWFDGPLLGARISPQLPIWENQFDTRLFPFLRDHQVGGAVIVPATVFLEMALEAARQILGDGPVDIEELEIQRPLVLEDKDERIVRLTWLSEAQSFRIESRLRMRGEGWTQHVVGQLRRASAEIREPKPLELPSEGRTLSRSEFYQFASRRGFDYGPSFALLEKVRIVGDAAIVQLSSPEESSGPFSQCLLNPALADAALQSIIAILEDRAHTDDRGYIPQKIGRLFFFPDRGAPALIEVDAFESARSILARCVLRTADGRVVAEMRGVRLIRMDLRGKSRGTIENYETRIVPLAPLEQQTFPAECRGVIQSTLAQMSADPATQTRALVLNNVAAAFAVDALIALGETADVPPERQALLASAIDLAEGVGSEKDAASVWSEAARTHPELVAELTLLARAGKSGASVFQGGEKIAPSAALLEHLFDSAPSFAAGNDLIAKAVESFTRAWPRSRRLRVLEAGAGTGGLTHRLLRVLPEDEFDLVLADREEAAVANLKAKFGFHPDVQVVQADLDDVQDALSSHGFDLIVSAYSGVNPVLLAPLASPGADILLVELASEPWVSFALGGDGSGPVFSLEQLQDLPIKTCNGVTIVYCRAPDAIDQDLEVSASDTKPWIVLHANEEARYAKTLAADLIGRGHSAIAVSLADDRDAWELVWNDILRRHGSPRGVIHLAGLQQYPDSAAAMLALQDQRCIGLLSALQALRKADSDASPQIVLVTHRALALNATDATLPEQAPLAGIGRVLQNEYPGGCRIVDLHTDDGNLTPLLPGLATEIAHESSESEVLLKGDARFGLRLQRAKAAKRVSVDGIERLTTKGGSLDNLRWESVPRRELAPNEVEIAVKATGLNFRDVMFALGVLPDEVLEGGFAGAALGMEAAGVITRVGAAVTDLKVGDRAVCFAPSALASHVVTDRFAVVVLPDNIDFASGATMTTAFFTVCYALGHLGRLAAGERVLIHGAAGAVGMAAIQYARHVGAEVFSTAGSDEKRQIVELMGVPADRIFDSRSNDFADRIAAVTGGEGVDVVLNSIAGDAVPRGLSLLRPFGRFLELGKADFVANSRIGLRPFRNNVTYFGVDADQLMAKKPALAQSILIEMMSLFANGAFNPLPYRVFGRDQVVDAFRHLQQSRHVGKIVVAMDELVAAESIQTPEPIAIDPNATYLVTGGLRGLGLATAQWLAQKGAKHLVLASRNGASSDTSPIDALRAGGVAVDIRACDVGNEDDVASLIADVRSIQHPLKGIVHAAAIYDDAFAMDLSADRFRSVLTAKAAGAWALDRATREEKLDFFLLYSSISAALGNPGQANYVAANLFVESLAAKRRAEGFPATVAILPPVADTGHLSERENVAANLAKIGVRPVVTEEVFARLDRLLERKNSDLFFADVDWRKLSALPAIASAKYRALAVRRAEGEAVDARADLETLARELGPEALMELLQGMLAKQIGFILRIAPERLDVQRSIFDLGMDSLMGLELRMSISEEFGIELPSMALSQDVSIHRVAEMLCDRALGRQGGAEAELSAVEAERKVILSRHAEAVTAEDIEQAMEDLDRVPPTRRGRLTQ